MSQRRYTLWLLPEEAERVERYLERERERALAQGMRAPKDSPLLAAALLRGIGEEPKDPAPKRTRAPKP